MKKYAKTFYREFRVVRCLTLEVEASDDEEAAMLLNARFEVVEDEEDRWKDEDWDNVDSWENTVLLEERADED